MCMYVYTCTCISEWCVCCAYGVCACMLTSVYIFVIHECVDVLVCVIDVFT